MYHFQQYSLIFLLQIIFISSSHAFESPDSINNQSNKNQIHTMVENIDNQISGNSEELQRRPAGPLGTQQSAWRNPRKTKGQMAPGVIRYSWSQAHVMSINLRDFMTTTVIFPHWEKITSFYTGDPYVFQADQAQSNVLVLRANNPGADTNFTAIGESGFVYSFYVRSESWNSKMISDFIVYVEAPNPTSYWGNHTNSINEQLGFKTTQNSGVNQVLRTNDGKAIQIPDYVRDILFKPEELKFDLKIFAKTEKDAEIAPDRVFRDNEFTYFDYGDRADNVLRPVIFQVIDKVDTHVNTRTAGPKGNIIIAEGVGDFTLRNGNRVICVRRDLKNSSATKTVLIDKKRK